MLFFFEQFEFIGIANAGRLLEKAGEGDDTRAGAWDTTRLKPQVCFFKFFLFYSTNINYG